MQKLLDKAALDMPLEFTIPNDIKQMQQDDPTLAALLLRAKGEIEVKPDINKEQYIL